MINMMKTTIGAMDSRPRVATVALWSDDRIAHCLTMFDKKKLSKAAKILKEHKDPKKKLTL